MRAENPLSDVVIFAAVFTDHLFFTGPIGPTGLFRFGCCRSISVCSTNRIARSSLRISARSLHIKTTSCGRNSHLKNRRIMPVSLRSVAEPYPPDTSWVIAPRRLPKPATPFPFDESTRVSLMFIDQIHHDFVCAYCRFVGIRSSGN